MANKDFEQGAGPLPEKVKGKTATEGAGFKSFTGGEGAEDEQKFDGSNVGVKHPEDSKKSLPKAGGLS